MVIVTYPQTAFSEAMYSNTPTILIIKKDNWQFSQAALRIFNILKENKIAFENFNVASAEQVNLYPPINRKHVYMGMSSDFCHNNRGTLMG